MSILFDSGPSLRFEEFCLFQAFFRKLYGIEFHPDSQYAMERRLRERILHLGFRDFAEYYRYLRYAPEGSTEIEEAIDLLTTNETYFFREEYQLRSFARNVLPDLHEKLLRLGTRRLSLWSAGCSTGEEAYTLGMLIVESGLFENWDIRIFGNDISRRVLRVARRAVYGEGSFRSMPSRYYRFFVKTPEGMMVHPRIRSLVHFGHLNLLDEARVALVGRVDAVFCRNVLIYFDMESRRKVLRILHDRVCSGGYLFLGHSESLLNVSTAFELVQLPTDLVYRRAPSQYPERIADE